MARKPPFYSDKPGDLVYHNNDGCEEARQIERMFRVEGSDGRPLCKRCADLDRRAVAAWQ